MISVLDLKPEIAEIRDEIDAAIKNVIDNTAFIMGPVVKQFEKEVAEYLGAKHAIGVNSGTDALVIGMKALGIKEGDEVITTPFSFFATAESISILGAKPVFVDIIEGSYNIDPAEIEKAITPKTKAIVPVHLYGQACQMSKIMEIAEKHNLLVVEDCAQSFGARYFGNCIECDDSCESSYKDQFNGKQTGTIGHVGAYSFFPSKNLGAFGDGGLITTNDDAVAEQARMLRVHGAKKKYHNEVLGFNSRLDSIQAAILRVKLPHIDKWNSGRAEAAKRYKEFFAIESRVITPDVIEGHVFHQYTIRVKDTNRDQLQADLKEAGVGSMIYYPVPQDMLPVYKKDYTPCPVSKKLSDEVISLPIWPSISPDVQNKVADALLKALS